MACNRTLLRILKRREKEKKNSFAVDSFTIHDDSDREAHVRVFLWMSKSIDGQLTDKIRVGELTNCYVAFDVWDYRLSRKSLTHITNAQKGKIKINEADDQGLWTSTFIVRGPERRQVSNGLNHDCGYDMSPAKGVLSGLEKIQSHWNYGSQKKTSELEISITVYDVNVEH